jgi:hypothetical protein
MAPPAGRGDRLKYVLLIYSNPETWAHPVFLHQREMLSDDERRSRTRQFETLISEISESGELIACEALAEPSRSRTIRIREGVPVSTDGPFAEAKEQLAGYFVVDCESHERALEIASRFPDLGHSPIEVRPLMDASGMEM